MRIITWNINSVRLRLPHLVTLNAALTPDIICLQETKVIDNEFPHNAIKALGYEHLAFRGEKSYNGVAILSKIPFTETLAESFGGNDDKRHIAIRLSHAGKTVELHNFYVPAGGDEPDVAVNPKYAHKLAFVEDMTAFFAKKRTANDALIMVGDLNIAPLEHDVWSHKQLLDVVSHTPPELERIEALRKTLQWCDTHRYITPEPEKLYSWWSYRNQDWKKSNRGRRLDHIWVTPPLAGSIQNATILKEARDWEKPSDHVPVVLDIA
jgi:exodeoxyribonuclease-3